MRIHRGSLFWGVFFLLLGGIPLADRQGLIDVAGVVDFGRLWPLAIIAIGVAVLVSRTQFALVGTLLAAAMIGGLSGTALAVGGGFASNLGDCGATSSATMQQLSRSGSLDERAAVELDFSCGTLDMTTAGGNDWSLAADYRGAAPVIDARSGRLSLSTPDNNAGRQEWKVTLPRERLRSLDVEHNAGTARLDLSGTRLAELTYEANAGDTIVIAENATVSELDVEVNAGRARITLGGETQGRLEVNAGSLQVCVPANAQLRITLHEQLTFGTNLAQRGLTKTGDTWRRTGSGGPTIRLDVSGNAASFDLDPTGGCR